MQTRIGTLRDWTWQHSREWGELEEQHPTLYDEISRLLAVYADAPEGPRKAP